MLHPGGSIGASLIKVADIMHKGLELPYITEDALMSDVILSMTSHGFGCAAIVNQEGDLVGIVTDGDLRRHMSSDLLLKSAREVMTKNPVTIKVTAIAAEALSKMNSRSITSLFVMDSDKVVGIVHIHDCLRAGIK